MNKGSNFSLTKALCIIFVSTLCVSGVATCVWMYYSYQRVSRAQEEKYAITACVLSSPYGEDALKGEYVAELLEISVDAPMSVYQFDCSDAEKTLRSQPFIKDAHVSIRYPDTVSVDYILRKPYAYLGDYENVAIDVEGYMFPMTPFYTPKNIPEIYLGTGVMKEDEEVWTALVGEEKLQYVFSLYEELLRYNAEERFLIKSIDISKVEEESAGQRYIVVALEDNMKRGAAKTSYLLRMSPKGYEEAFKHFLELYAYIHSHDDEAFDLETMACMIVDLRIPDLAFVDTRSK
jgi:hypothetical protein